jgi:hypothetical protein
MSDIKEQYTFVTDKDSEWTCIGVKGGKYDGVVYKYGKVNILEDEENDTARLQFEWDVVDSNGLPREMLGEDFFSLIGDILVDILEDHLSEEQGLVDESND